MMSSTKKNLNSKENDFLGFTLKQYLYYILGLLILSLIIAIWLGLAQAFRLVYGSVFALFLPGFLLSHLFYDKRKIDLLERIALSFALSISIIPLLVFYLNLIGLRVNTLNSILIISGVCVLATAWLVIKKKI